jgi:hypothetical protein
MINLSVLTMERTIMIWWYKLQRSKERKKKEKMNMQRRERERENT